MEYRQVLCAIMALTIGFFASAWAAPPEAYRNDPALLEQSKKYSETAVRDRPELGILLRKIKLQYLHELDPGKVYNLNLDSGAVTMVDVDDGQITPTAVPGFSFGTPKVIIGATASSIIGEASTTVTCLFGGQTAEVFGFMASTVSRDPRGGGVRHGTLVVDNILSTKALANFSILKASGGARNPINRTVLESTHTGSCGSELRVANLVSTWPPLRIEMAVDDTGSMGTELAGAKAGLSAFINQQQEPNNFQREVYYELISFKDAPTIRLPSTTDGNAAKAAVESLFPGGGGDCPEDAIGAMNLALSRLDEETEGAIVLVTDASPRAGDVGNFIAAAQAARVRVHVLLSGDCVTSVADTRTAAASNNGEAQVGTLAGVLSARIVFERIARETGGTYVYLPGGTAQQYADILMEIFASAYNGDNEPPVVSVKASPGELWPPNHRLIPIDVQVSATDNKDPAPLITLEGITSSEPDNGMGDGDTAGDIIVGKNGLILLRAERNGSGPGRIYTITYRAVDTSGNVGFGSVEVVVPHNRK